MRKYIPIILLLLLAVSGLQAQPTLKRRADPSVKAPVFTVAPVVVREKDRFLIRFEVSRFCDAAVAVIDRQGKVVRHLAAGILGENAPAPFVRNSLKQEIVWDGRDDLGRILLNTSGKKVAEGEGGGGPFTIRVSIGMQPVLEQYAGRGDQTVELRVFGMAVNGSGELFVMMADSFGRSEIRVFSSQGNYLRTVMPYSSRVPEKRLEPLGRLKVNGEHFPVVFSAHGQNYHPLTAGMKHQQMCFSPQGHLLFASAVGTYINHGPPRYLLALHPQGGAPIDTGFVGPRILHPRGMLGGAGEAAKYWFDAVAVSPDGKAFYLTTSGTMKRKTIPAHHAVFRVKWTDRKLGKPFFGEHQKPGSDQAHLNKPRGLAVDKEGRVYVCDWGNSRIVILKPDGSFVGSFQVKNPYFVTIHPARSTIYVLTREKDKHPLRTEIIKFAPWTGKTTEQARIRAQKAEIIAVNPYESGPTAWVYMSTENRKLPRGIRPVLDKGDHLEVGPPINNRKGLYYPMYVSADPDRDRVLITEMRAEQDFLNLKTDTLEYFRGGLECTLDADGNIYMLNRYRIQLERYTPEGKPLPFSGTGNHIIRWFKGKTDNGKDYYYNAKAHMCARGHLVAGNGDIYVAHQSFSGTGQVDVYGPDGKLKKQAVIRNTVHGSSGLGLDVAGNIYIGTNLRPEGEPLLPFGFDKAVPGRGWVWWREKRETPWNYPYYNAYLFHWGRIFKFSSRGGAFFQKGAKSMPENPDKLPAYQTGYLTRKVRVRDALWSRPGFGVVPTAGLNWGDPNCSCFTARFAVDPFGRIFSPDPFRCCVAVLDTNGNSLKRIGNYGNADDARPGRTGADIVFGWPGFVSYAREKIYVSDCLNRQVAVIRLDYADSVDVELTAVDGR